MRNNGQSDQVNILLVDDRWENLVSLKAVLDRPDYNLVKACSGQEALRKLLDEDFALILLDVQMPIMDGFETAKLIKERERTRRIPIIFISGLSVDASFIFKGYEAGAVDYLCKPFDPNVLRSKVLVFAELHRKTEQVQRQAELLRTAELARLENEVLKREQKANQQYRDLVDGINHGIVWVADPTTLALTFVSPQIQHLLGYPPEQWVNNPNFWHELLPLEDRSLVFNTFQVLEKSMATPQFRKDFSIEHRMLRANGEVRWVHTGARLIYDEVAQRFELRGLSVDITHLKKVEQKLYKSEERLRLLAEISSVIAEGLDYNKSLRRVADLAIPIIADYCFLEVLTDDQQLEMVACSHIDLEQKNLLKRLHKEHLYRLTLLGPGPLFLPVVTNQVLDEIGLDHPAQQALQELQTTSLIKVPFLRRGRHLGHLVLCYTTSRRNYDVNDLDFTHGMAHRCSTSIDNARLYQEAKMAVDLRDEFLSIASHELKTPLTPLKMQIQNLHRQLQKVLGPENYSEKMMKMLDSSERQVNRLIKLVAELLDVSRINNGKMILDLEEINLVEVVQDVLGRFSEDLKKVGCVINFKAPPTLSGVWDRPRVEQILNNLLTNALRYAPGKPIRVEMRQENGQAVLEVEDHGMGIAPKDRERIFHRFERAVPSTDFGGLGLGLYIVKQIVEAHEGSISVSGALGEGSTFTVRLPLRPVQMTEDENDSFQMQ